jgi:adenylate cyclase
MARTRGRSPRRPHRRLAGWIGMMALTEVWMSHGEGEGPTAVAAGEVSRDRAIDALRRILASDAFADSPRARDFLAFVVRETLDGRGARLKERTVARGALDRSASFDPRSDSGVRVQARRVRVALEKYYADEGRLEEVRISLPKGSYIPVISPAPDTPAPIGSGHSTTTLGPGVAVVRFTRPVDDDASAALAIGLTESLAGALSSFPGIRVVGPVEGDGPSPTAPAERRLGARLHVQYVVRGAVLTSKDAVFITVRLVDAGSGEVVWAESFDRPAAELAGFTGQDDVVRRVAGAVGDYGGAVLRHAAHSGGQTANPVVWSAMLAFYEGLERASPESASRLQRSLLEAHEVEPENALVLSMLASTESYLAIYSDAHDPEAMAEACVMHARRALALDPSSGHAHLTLGIAALSRGNVPLCLEHLRLAVELGPNDPSILYGAGWYFGVAGEWDFGVSLVRESVRLNPTSPTLRYVYLAVDELIAEDFAAALADAMRYPHEDEVWQPLLLALALAGLGYRDEASAEVARAATMVPDLRRHVRESQEFPRMCLDVLASQLDDLLGTDRGPA